MRFGDPEGDDTFIPPRMGHLPYGPPPSSRYTTPLQMGYYPTRFGEPESPPIVPTRPHSRMRGSMPIIEVRGPERTGPSTSRRSVSPERIVWQAPPAATVLDPSSRHSPHSPPRSSQPLANIINDNVPPTTAHSHSHSRSPSRRHRGSSHYRDAPTLRDSRDGSYSPRIVHTSSCPPQSRRAETVLVREEGSPRGRSRGRSRSRSPIIVPATGAGSSRHDGRRSERIGMMGEGGESRRSRSRSPRPILVAGPQESRRPRSRSPRTILVQEPTTRRSSRSGSPT